MRLSPAIAVLLSTTALQAIPGAPEARFRAQTLDAKLQIGYGLAIADVDGDGKPDILLCDAKETAWYRNPEWTKHRMTGALTKLDHVCIAARNLDQKVEVAVGAEWNPGDTNHSGAVLSLTAPEDRTREWSAQPQHREPTVHRMHWVKDEAGKPFLAVLPLHGCGNTRNEGAGIRFLGYRPDADPSKPWPTFLIPTSSIWPTTSIRSLGRMPGASRCSWPARKASICSGTRQASGNPPA